MLHFHAAVSNKQTNCISGTGRLNKPPICSRNTRRWAGALLSEGRAAKFIILAKWSHVTFSQKETSLMIFPCVILWISKASLFLKYHKVRPLYCINAEHLFWTDRVFSSVLCCDVHSHHFNICSGQTVCSAQFCALMYTAITSIFVLDRPCVQLSSVLWCAQPSLQYLFCTDRVFSSVLCSDVHNHHLNICSGQTVCSAQFCALMYTAIT